MSLPATQVVIDQLAAWLELIRQSNGYHTNAGLHVETEELDDIANPPAASLLLLDEAADATGKGWTLALTVEAVLQVEPDSARATGRKVLADVRRALAEGPKAGAQDTRVIRAVRVKRTELPRRAPGENLITPTVDVEVEYHDPI